MMRGYSSAGEYPTCSAAASPPQHVVKGGELSMAKYLIRAAIPTVYVIDARDAQEAMHQAAKRFKTEQHTQLEPELQWAKLKGTASTAIWRIAA
jgi:hypothetical protein